MRLPDGFFSQSRTPLMSGAVLQRQDRGDIISAAGEIKGELAAEFARVRSVFGSLERALCAGELRAIGELPCAVLPRGVEVFDELSFAWLSCPANRPRSQAGFPTNKCWRPTETRSSLNRKHALRLLLIRLATRRRCGPPPHDRRSPRGSDRPRRTWRRCCRAAFPAGIVCEAARM